MSYQPALFPRVKRPKAAQIGTITYQEVHRLREMDKLVPSEVFIKRYQGWHGLDITHYLGSLKVTQETVARAPKLWLKRLDEPLMTGVQRWSVRYYLGTGIFACELTWLAHSNVSSRGDTA